MRVVQNNDGSGKLIYDQEDWLAGIDKNINSAGVDGKIGNGFTEASNIDPMRKLGYLTTGRVGNNVTNSSSVTDMLRTGVMKDSDAYCIGGDKVQKVGNLITGTVSTTAPFPHTVTHGAHSGIELSDCCNYYIGDKLYLFYSFYDTTDFDVGIHEYGTSNFDDDFMSTVPANPLSGTNLTDGNSIHHPMIVIEDVLYIASGRYVHAFDGQEGANGTLYTKVFTLPSGYEITCFSRTDNNDIVIGAYYKSSTTHSYRGNAAVYIWNTKELDPTTIYDIEANYISEIFRWNGTIACFTYGGKEDSITGGRRLKYLANGRFETLLTFNSESPIRGGVDVSNSSIYFNSSGNIYALSKDPYTNGWSFNQTSSCAGTKSGMCRLFFGSIFIIHASSGDGAIGGLEYFSTGYSSGNVFLKRAFLSSDNRKKYRVKNVSIIFRNNTDGGKVSLAVDLDKEGFNDFISQLEPTDKTKYTFEIRSNGKAFGDFNSLTPYVTFQEISGVAPIIHSIEIEYEPINL